MTPHRVLFTYLTFCTFALVASAQTTGGTTTGGGMPAGGTTGGGLGGGLSGGSGGFGTSGTSGTSGGSTFTIQSANLDTGVKSASGTLGYPLRVGSRGTTNTGDPLSHYYINPMAIQYTLAQSGATAVPQFGTPMYATLYPGTQITSPFSATQNVTGAARVSPAGAGGFGALGGANNFGTINYKASPTYTTGLGFKYDPPAPTQVQATIQAVLARSTNLPKGLEVAVDGPTLVLRGKVADPAQKRLAETLVKLTPGVKAVRNELEVQEKAPAAKPGH